MDKLLNLLDKNCRLTNEQLAVMLDEPVSKVAVAIENYEAQGIIRLQGRHRLG